MNRSDTQGAGVDDSTQEHPTWAYVSSLRREWNADARELVALRALVENMEKALYHGGEWGGKATLVQRAAELYNDRESIEAERDRLADLLRQAQGTIRNLAGERSRRGGKATILNRKIREALAGVPELSDNAASLTSGEPKEAIADPLDPHREKLTEALEYLADAENWAGDPHHHDVTLFGHETPYEVANRVLAETKQKETP